MKIKCGADNEHLFEPEFLTTATQVLVTRSQPAVGMAADLGGTRSVGGAAAQTPVTNVKADSYRHSTRSRAMCEAQVPGSGRVLTQQELNNKSRTSEEPSSRLPRKSQRLVRTQPTWLPKKGGCWTA